MNSDTDQYLGTDIIAARIAGLSPEKRALLLKRLSGSALTMEVEKPGAEELLQAAPIVVQSRAGDLSLSFAQQRLWFLERLLPAQDTYNIPAAWRLRGRLDVPALERSLDEVVTRHAALRARFTLRDGEPAQVIDPPRSVGLPLTDLSAMQEAEREAHARRFAEAHVRQPFDLERGPLLRAQLLRLAAEEHLLLLNVHHIAYDGWSAGVFEREISVAYCAFVSGQEPQLLALPIQYTDYAAWQREWLQGEVLESELGYWKGRLAGVSTLELPTDRPRPPVFSYQGAHLAFDLPAPLTEALKALGWREGATLFMTLLTALQVLLHRYSGQEDIAVGTPIAGRGRIELEGLIGFFANTLVLRSDLSGNPRFRQLLARVRESTLIDYVHQHLPFEKLVEELAPERDLSRNPLFQVAFALQNTPASALALDGIQVSPVPLQKLSAKFDLTLTLRETPQGLQGNWEFNTDLFDAQTIARMAGHFRMLLDGIVADADQRIGELPLLTESERHQLLVEWNDTAADYPKDRCIHELFEGQAARAPEAVAVVFEHQQLTYGELNARANRWALYLISLGVGPEVMVGICMERSLELVIGLLAILKAGGAYVPLDPSYPKERLAFMLKDTATPVLLTQHRLLGELPPYDGRILCLDRHAPDANAHNDANAPHAVTSDALAYVIYTSGSTGEPKGVLVRHRGVVRLVKGTDYVSLNADDTLLHLAPLAFDASTFELWGALLNGARVVVMPPGQPSLAQIGAAVCDHRITTLWLSAGLFHLMVDERLDDLKPLRQLLAGGDVLSAEHLMKARRALPECRIINGYGPTENTTFTCCYIVRDERDLSPTVPIGRPIANTRVYLLDPLLQPVPIGVVGELCAGGAGVARGYWQRPELSAERFIPDPYADAPGAQMYRTGDLARYRPDGNIEFLGRADGQIKLRGFRIELGEIEAVLAEHSAVRQAVVLAYEDTPGDKRLVAYVVPAAASLPDVEPLRAKLRRRLPDHMQPSSYVVLERLPLTPNGKIDRRALPAPQYDDCSAPGGAFVAPRDSLEELLAGVWCEVLKLERVDVNDSFFKLGGHSLLAAQVVARLAKLLKVELPLRRVFEAPTVAALALEVKKIIGVQAAMETPPITRAGRTGNLPLSFGQQRLWFLERLEEKTTAYHMSIAMRLRGELKRDVLERAINAVVARHESLRTHFVEVEGDPAQVITQALKIALPIEDLSALKGKAQEAALAAALQREHEAPFNLNQGPLLRTTLLKLGTREHILLRVFHHIVSDGWSTGVFNRELATLYQAFSEGRDNPLEPLAVQYADYALWQRRWLQGEALERRLAYWTNKLEGAPPLLALPTDRPRTAERSNRSESRTLDLPEALVDSLSAVCQRARATLFMALLAAFKVLLARHSAQEDIVIGTPIAARNHVAIEGLIGFFLSTIALRTNLSGNPTFEELLERVRTTALEAYAHQDLPFEKLIEKINPERNLSHTPVFQVLFNMHNFEEVPSFAGLEVERFALPDADAKFDLTLYATEVRGRLRFRAVYNAELFDGARIEWMLDQLQHLLTQVAENPSCPIHDYSLVTRNTTRLLPDPATVLAAPLGVPVFRQFLAVAQANATRSALRHEHQDWTYQQLEDTSKRIAKQLVARGVKPGEIVVVSGQRSLGLVASILGVLGARGIFLLIDASLPPTRRDLMLQEVRGTHWLHVGDDPVEDGNWSAAFRGLPATRISSDGLSLDPTGVAAMEDIALVDSAPGEAAYIFFTSGTTGKPKAIAGSHKGLSHFIDWERQVLGVVHHDRVAQLTGMSFDVVLRDIFLPLTSGATLCLPRPEIVSQGDQLVPWLRREGITILHAVPSLARTWLDSLPSETHVPTLRWVLFAGEPLTDQLILQWRKHIGGEGGTINLYGPTETTLAKCFHVLPAVPGVGVQPIGRPLPQTQALVLSQGGQLCGIGEPGEIVIRTPFRTLGYLNGSDSDRARFATNPFRDDPSDLVYRTGDIGAYDTVGQLRISGRLDDQIKIRGSRVEPAEVEATLARHPDVQQCVVVARQDGCGEKWLVAYVVQRPDCAFAGSVGWRDFLKRSLPDYMIPSAFVVLEKLPLTPNGKLDHKALPAPSNMRSHLAPDYVGPRNTAEVTLVDFWKELLKLDEVGVHDDFFELGGHSLIATRLASKIRKDFNIEIPLRAIFENPTVDGLARRVLELQTATMDSHEMEELIRELEALPEEYPQSRACEIKESSYPFPAPEKQTQLSTISQFSCPNNRSEIFGARQCNLLIVVNERFEKQSFERVAEFVHKLDPCINALVATDTASMELSLPKNPALIFSPALIRHQPPIAARTFCGYPLSKSQEYAALEKAGIPVPTWALLSEDNFPDLSSFDDYVVRKPDYGGRGAEVKVLRKNRVKWKPTSTRSAGPSSALIVQKFIYTGPRPVSYRVNTLFGRVLYSSRYEAHGHQRELTGPNDFREAGISDIVASRRDGQQSLNYEADVIRLGELAHSAFPEIPLLGFDIVREVPSRKLFVLEANAIGYVWNFRSGQEADYGFSFEEQFDGVRKAAYILAEKTQQYAR